MKDLFLFSQLIDGSHDFTYLFHLILVAILILVVARFAISNIQLVPRGVQNIMEAYLAGVDSMGKSVLGDEKLARKYLPLVATIGFVVGFSNLIGIIPGFESPSSSINLTLALALCVFLYYNFEGIKTKGFFTYFGHFMGPNIWLAPIMFPVEIISHLSRVISLSFRLFGNIKGDDTFLLVVLTLAPWVAPLPAFALLFLMAFLQAFIFMILTYVYLAGAVLVEEEH